MSGFVALVITPVWMRASQACFNNYDLGIYAQALSQLSLSNPNPWISGRQIFIFADHFDPILFLAKPLTLWLPVPFGALLAEAVFVVLSILPVLWLGARGDLDRRAALLLSAVLLFNASTLQALLFPVHPTTWAVFPWTLLVAALWTKRTALMFVALVLLFACKEEFPLVGVVLGFGLVMRGERRTGLAVLGLSITWFAGAMLARPLLGTPADYAARLTDGLDQGIGSYVASRLTARGMWYRIGITAALFAPMAAWAALRRRRPDLVLLGLLLPPLGIRILGAAWHHHYWAVMVAGLVAVAMVLIGRERPPRWLIATTVLALVATGERHYGTLFRTLFPPSGAMSTAAGCPGEPGRLASIREALTLVRDAPGRALLQGNLLPMVAERDDIYMVGGPMPEDAIFHVVAVEKPPRGDPWPLTQERYLQLIEAWRAAPGTHVLKDDPHVFVARGAFREVR